MSVLFTDAHMGGSHRGYTQLKRDRIKRSLKLLAICTLLLLTIRIYISGAFRTVALQDRWRVVQSTGIEKEKTIETILPSPASPGQPSLPFHLELERKPDLDVASTLERHMKNAEAIQEELLGRQSKTLQQAVDRYERLNSGRRASDLFKDWASFAIEHDSPIIDDYGQAVASFSPFQGIDPDDLEQRVQNVLAQEDLYWRGKVLIRSGQVYVEDGPKEVVEAVRQVLKPLNGTTSLPDMTLLTNWDDLPRVTSSLGDPQSNAFHTSAIPLNERLLSAKHGCPGSSTITKASQSRDRPAVDMCEADDNLASQHGYFTFGIGQLDTLVPIASFTRLSTSDDVIIPHPCYGVENYRTWDYEGPSVPFEERLSSVYWRGSSTGSIPRLATWRFGHRPRFVKLMQAMRKYTGLYKQRGKSADSEVVSSLFTGASKALKLQSLQALPSSMFNVSFTTFQYCETEPEACQEMQKEMPVITRSPSANAFMHKYLFDLDGNSQSCRFYRLLETESLVFKQTIWNEWHDDRIIPWLHYIPVSTSYQEIPVLLNYFHNHPIGKLHAARIAREGIKLAQSSLRHIDLTIYWFRLMVEYADVLRRRS